MSLTKLNARLKREFSSALMSDTKWRKLFEAIAGSNIEQTIVKFVDSPEPKVIRPPALHPPRPYVDTIEFGPVELRAIEWLEIPVTARWPRGAGVTDRLVPQDIDGLSSVIASLGKYPVERTTDGLRVIGYLR